MTQAADIGEAIARACIPERLARPLHAALRGDLPPNVGLMHLIIEAVGPEEVADALDAATRALGPGSEPALRVDALRRLWQSNPNAWRIVKGVLAQVAHDREAAADTGEALARTAAEFDRAAAVAPDAGAALYALGSPAILAAATSEIVGRLREWGLTGPERLALELGCGNGRVTARLAPEMGAIIGTDISRAMLQAAGLGCGGNANALLVQVTGRDLACFAQGRFDLVLAVDSFPYLVQAGGDLAGTHVADAAHILKPAGDLVILNYSYRGDAGADRAEVATLASANGFEVLREGERPFSLWDGVAFHLRKRSEPNGSRVRPGNPGRRG